VSERGYSYAYCIQIASSVVGLVYDQSPEGRKSLLQPHRIAIKLRAGVELGKQRKDMSVKLYIGTHLPAEEEIKAIQKWAA
jgi:hypothetical protein